ncbi:MAG: TIGR03067 domain-containing protein [Gemmataceae bacterium]
MIRILVIGGLGFILVHSNLPRGAQNKTESLEGVWKVLSIKENGMALPKSEIADLKLTVVGKVLVMNKGKTRLYDGLYVRDNSKKPKTLDVTFTMAKKKIQWIGIYRLEDETLTVCGVPKGKKRPTDFTSKKGSARQLAVYKRVKKYD